MTILISAVYLAAVLLKRLPGVEKGGVVVVRSAVGNFGFWFKNELAALKPNGLGYGC